MSIDTPASAPAPSRPPLRRDRQTPDGGSSGAERSDPTQIRVIPVENSYSLGVGGSYRIGRNLDVTGGLRYKVQRDRLEPIADERRDSQAVYIGTAFRF